MKKTKRGSLAFRDEFLNGRLGIRGKIVLYLVMLAGFAISLTWVSQSALLLSTYAGQRGMQVRNAGDTLIRNIGRDNLEVLADRLSAENDLCMMLVDQDGEPVISADHVRFCLLHGLSRPELNRWVSRAPEDGSALTETLNISPFRNDGYDREHFVGEVPANKMESARSMMYVRRVDLPGGKRGTLLMNANLAPGGTVAETARRQFLMTSAIILLAALGMGFSMAAGISKPIIETHEAAKKLSEGRYTRPAHSGGYREIAELNDTLVRAAEDLNKVEDLQQELIANISHDLRTPLTMIQGYAEVMRDIPEEMTPENMQIIIDETNRLSSLVNEVTEFSRLRKGTFELEKTDFDLTDLIRGICARIGAMTEQEGYRILFEETEAYPVHADESRISQVIYNLLGNALTYTGEDKTVRVSMIRKGDTVRTEIRDSGEGIAADELPLIWDRYYRTRETHKRAVIGSGLGLNICRGILERHDARYGAESQPGEGTVFFFELKTVENTDKEMVDRGS